MDYTFLITHSGSGGGVLSRMLNQNPRTVSMGSSGIVYDHPSRLNNLEYWSRHVSGRHMDFAMCVDKLVFNHQLPSPCFFDICRFVYMVRSPEKALGRIVQKGYDLSGAADYYAFRLRRMSEMSLKTPNSVLVDYDRMLDSSLCQKKISEIVESLDFRTPLHSEFEVREEGTTIDPIVLDRSRRAYDKHLSFMCRHLRY
jgi:hypothetical protein